MLHLYRTLEKFVKSGKNLLTLSELTSLRLNLVSYLFKFQHILWLERITELLFQCAPVFPSFLICAFQFSCLFELKAYDLAHGQLLFLTHLNRLAQLNAHFQALNDSRQEFWNLLWLRVFATLSLPSVLYIYLNSWVLFHNSCFKYDRMIFDDLVSSRLYPWSPFCYS